MKNKTTQSIKPVCIFFVSMPMSLYFCAGDIKIPLLAAISQDSSAIIDSIKSLERLQNSRAANLFRTIGLVKTVAMSDVQNFNSDCRSVTDLPPVDGDTRIESVQPFPN